MPNSRPSSRAPEDVELMRLYNCSATALELLYESAAAGSGAAREKLHHVCDTLTEGAMRYSMTNLED